MATSHVDSNEYSKGIQRALKVRGTKQSPNDLNTDQIQMTVDAVQSGFSICERSFINMSDAFTGGAPNKTFTFIDPNSPVANRNNRLRELRFLFLEIIVGNVTPVNNAVIRFDVNMVDPADSGNTVRGIKMSMRQQTGRTLYALCLPGTTDEGTGSDQSYNTNHWHGWLPANTILEIEVAKSSNFTGAETFQIQSCCVEVPKGAHLPM